MNRRIAGPAPFTESQARPLLLGTQNHCLLKKTTSTIDFNRRQTYNLGAYNKEILTWQKLKSNH